MKKTTKRNFIFEGRENDFSSTLDIRELATEKTLLDSIELEKVCPEDFKIFRGENLLTTFTGEDFESENVDLTLKTLKSKVLEIKENESYIQKYVMQENKQGERKKVAVNYLLERHIEIVIE